MVRTACHRCGRDDLTEDGLTQIPTELMLREKTCVQSAARKLQSIRASSFGVDSNEGRTITSVLSRWLLLADFHCCQNPVKQTGSWSRWKKAEVYWK